MDRRLWGLRVGVLSFQVPLVCMVEGKISRSGWGLYVELFEASLPESCLQNGCLGRRQNLL